MNLYEMVVTNSKGETKSLSGQRFPKDDACHFYAVQQEGTAPVEVELVRPVGGDMSGIARFPCVGEKVLVAAGETGKYYLMGYLSNKENPFNAQNEDLKETLCDEQAQSFRYKKTGGNVENEDTDKAYSEIGFYSETTEWKEKDGKKNPKTDSETGLPLVDKVKIASTGDIETKAQNYNEVSAKRIAFFAGYNDDIDSRKVKQKKNLKAGKTETDRAAFPSLPLDNPYEDVSFLQGDIQMRAKERIVLKAGKCLEIVVGRSIVRIDDTGISLVSRKVSGSVVNDWDSALTISSRGGISAFGTRVAISSAYGFSMSEAFGGEVSSLAGVTRIYGHDIKLMSTCKSAYVVSGTCASLSFAGNVTSMSMGIADNQGKNIPENVPFRELIAEVPSYFSLGAGVAGMAICANQRYACSLAEDSDMAGNIRVLTDFLLTVLDLVGSVLEKVFIPEPNQQKGGADGLTLALSVVEFGLVIQQFIRLSLACVQLRNKAIVLLDHRGTLYESSFVKKTYSTRKTEAQSSMAGAEKPSLIKELWYGFNRQPNWAIALESIAALSLVAGAPFAYFNKSDVDAAVKEELEKL